MGTKLVECLNCGATRRVALEPSRPAQPDECMRCGYVGWADAESLSESLRRALRENSPEQRRQIPAW